MTNRNSNLDRVIYDPSIVELDTMPVENPPMDNVMPSFDGREDPKVLEDYQQMELADGGVVEREGFYAGGSLEPQGETIKNLYLKGYSMESIAKQLNVTKSNLNNFLNSIKNPEIETPITITEEELSKDLLLIQNMMK